MARFQTIALGTRAREPFTFDLPGHPGVTVDLRPLSDAEEIEALAEARRMAKDKGVGDPKDGDPIYDRLVMAAVLVFGCVDAESPVDKPAPFFANTAEVLTLDRDSVVLLYEAHEAWQEQCSPRRIKLSDDEYTAMMLRLAEDGDIRPFVSLPRATLASCLATSARLLVSSRAASLPSTSASEPKQTETASDSSASKGEPHGDDGASS